MSEKYEKWDVIINGVTAGSLSANDLSQIDKAVQQDKRLYFAQFVNFLYAIWSAMTQAIHIVPLTLTCWAFAFACSDPDSFNTVVTANPAHFLFCSFMGSLGAAVLIVIASAGFGITHLNFENKFNARKEQLIRYMLKVPAKGDMTLCRVEGESAAAA